MLQNLLVHVLLAKKFRGCETRIFVLQLILHVCVNLGHCLHCNTEGSTSIPNILQM